jgi:asparagine synthase (glutamine-hydrolysing)
VREQVTVAVSGDGGDELFGGYGRYMSMRSRLAANMPVLDAIASYFAEGLPMFTHDTLQQALPGQEKGFRRRVISRFASAFARRDLDTIERLRLVDLHTYLPGAVLAKVDRMSMRHSLEVRTPFFHPDILKLSAGLPFAFCTNGKLLKLALRRLLARYLPEQLIRPVKQGFGMPASFFQTHAKTFSSLADEADSALAEWPALRDRPHAFATLKEGVRSNINSYWAWIALGQWTTSLPD